MCKPNLVHNERYSQDITSCERPKEHHSEKQKRENENNSEETTEKIEETTETLLKSGFQKCNHEYITKNIYDVKGIQKDALMTSKNQNPKTPKPQNPKTPLNVK